jgi:hypothetical protein
VDVTVGEMAMADKLLTGGAAEWSLVRRHESEDIFGVQIAGSRPDVVGKACELLHGPLSPSPLPPLATRWRTPARSPCFGSQFCSSAVLLGFAMVQGLQFIQQRVAGFMG